MINYIIIGLIAIGLFFAIKSIVKNTKNGGCAGCSACSGRKVKDLTPCHVNSKNDK
ncbi:FeoB-associated Cys-rich membrane protein [Tissierellaceae bacterium HCP3S3_D8]